MCDREVNRQLPAGYRAGRDSSSGRRRDCGRTGSTIEKTKNGSHEISSDLKLAATGLYVPYSRVLWEIQLSTSQACAL